MHNSSATVLAVLSFRFCCSCNRGLSDDLYSFLLSDCLYYLDVTPRATRALYTVVTPSLSPALARTSWHMERPTTSAHLQKT